MIVFRSFYSPFKSCCSPILHVLILHISFNQYQLSCNFIPLTSLCLSPFNSLLITALTLFTVDTATLNGHNVLIKTACNNTSQLSLYHIPYILQNITLDFSLQGHIFTRHTLVSTDNQSVIFRWVSVLAYSARANRNYLPVCVCRSVVSAMMAIFILHEIRPSAVFASPCHSFSPPFCKSMLITLSRAGHWLWNARKLTFVCKPQSNLILI